MTAIRIWVTLALGAIWANTGWASGHKVTLYLTDIPAQSMEYANEPGIGLELLREAAGRAGLTTEEAFLPWLRAVEGAEKGKNGFIIPFSRTKSREKRFQWVIALYDLQFGFVSNGDRVDNWEAARQLDNVGVWRGSSMQEELEERGFDNLHVLSDDKALNRLIIHHRIDAWYGALVESAWKFRSLPPSEYVLLKFGKPVKSSPVWLATGLRTDKAVIQAWRQAFEAMEKDGSYRRVLDKYGVYSEPGS